ncbi:type I-E CRISPR-associated protein Cse1/CasA [Streptomyces sp. NPDC059991]|uniref:type I-E CRISPR-associated protein Cse1/CasA n=1 Tax=Streptomyces sp. NPDC059991 TaxID=3347028 RepID=UPI0036AD884B
MIEVLARMPPDDGVPDPFPLALRPWAPVFTAGSTRRVGLLELFLEAHRLDGLAVAIPPAASGLMRILCAMAARITGLDEATDSGDWLDRRYALLEDSSGFEPDAVKCYFDTYAAGLSLHDPQRPFLQDPRLQRECSTSSGVNKLVVARPAGNNQVFFGHFTDAEQVALAPGEAVLHLIAQLYYGPSGQCTPRTVNGKRFGNTMAGPLRRVLSCHPLGRSLFETLVLGIPEPGSWPQAEGGMVDACPWEREVPADPLAPPGSAAGPLSLLTEQHQHAVLLQASKDGHSVVDATITWGLRHNRPAHRDPYLIWDERKDGQVYPRDAVAERALWRDLDALVLLRRGDRGRRPLIFDGLGGDQLPAALFRELRVVAYGFDQDGQTRDRTYFNATTPRLFALLNASDSDADTALAQGARQAREAAEKAAWHLSTALRSAWRTYTTPFTAERPAQQAPSVQPASGGGAKKTKGAGPWPDRGLAAYWPAAEELFWNLLEGADFSAAIRLFGEIALRVYDDTTASVAAQPRGARARESARGLVRTLLDHSRDR